MDPLPSIPAALANPGPGELSDRMQSGRCSRGPLRSPSPPVSHTTQYNPIAQPQTLCCYRTTYRRHFQTVHHCRPFHRLPLTFCLPSAISVLSTTLLPSDLPSPNCLPLPFCPPPTVDVLSTNVAALSTGHPPFPSLCHPPPPPVTKPKSPDSNDDHDFQPVTPNDTQAVTTEHILAGAQNLTRPLRACFGCGELVDKIVGLAENTTPTALIGPSGIGKTSTP